jgi:hypothetical protein
MKKTLLVVLSAVTLATAFAGTASAHHRHCHWDHHHRCHRW